jgi:serine protease Do
MQNGRSWSIHLLYIVVIAILGVLLGTSIAQKRGEVIQSGPAAAPVRVEGLEGFEKAFSKVAESVGPSVVNINTEQVIERYDPFDEEMRRFFGIPSQPYRERVTNLGSGVIVRANGYIVTNVHVIAGAQQIKVTLSNGKSYLAKPIAISEQTDLAVIKIEAGEKLTAAKLGDANLVKVGYWAIAMGSPFGLSKTVTVGIISAKGRVLGGRGGQFKDLLQTDASINQGNSGGPLVDLRGEVIGINQAILSPSRTGNIGIGFAIPINATTKQLIERMISGQQEGV